MFGAQTSIYSNLQVFGNGGAPGSGVDNILTEGGDNILTEEGGVIETEE